MKPSHTTGAAICSGPQGARVGRQALRMQALALALVTTVSLASPAHAAPNTKYLDAATKEQPALIESLKTMVSIESGSNDAAGLARMANLLDERLQALGFKTERIKSTKNIGANIVIGRLRGTGKHNLMLMAHMDTVYEQGILKTQPYKVDGNRIYGPGIADDKGGISVILHGLKILKDMGWANYGNLTVLFNPDEEIGSLGSGDLIATTAEQHHTVLSFEPTGAKAVAKVESLLLGAAGVGRATLEVKGRAAHAGVAPEQGRNAALEISHQMLQTRDVYKDHPGILHNWTNVVSNKATNQIPDLATAIGDVRITKPGAEVAFGEALKAKVASTKLIPDTESSLVFVVGRPAYLASPKGEALAARAKAIYQELDRPLALTPMTGGGTDAGYAARSGKATVLESFGLAGFGFHARDEYIEVDSVVPRLYLFTRLVTELGNDQGRHTDVHGTR
jgi:glutamate carboxypeptidase